ncbi:MAG: hypothetical protein PWP23_2109 [Candidatus Sumerlaeota bacterium]|nr:hypothetical protein [Candidatus Sumerlaeota bacterium]
MRGRRGPKTTRAPKHNNGERPGGEPTPGLSLDQSASRIRMPTISWGGGTIMQNTSGKTRRSILLLLLSLVLPLFLPASDFMELQRLRLERRLYQKAHPVEKTLSIPARLPNQPEYLVRAIYLMPTDRVPSDPDEYDARVARMTGIIRTALETISDFYAYEAERLGVASPGPTLNLEREADGSVRVMVLHGSRPTKGADGYWGDDTGNSWNPWFRTIEDLFGDYDGEAAATEKTVYLMFPDILEIDDSVTPSVWHAHIGAGSSINQSSQGWGGLGMVTAGSLEFLPPDPGNREERLAALESTFCATNTMVEINGRLVPTWNARPSTGENAQLTQAEQASTFLGVLAHEFLHTVGLGHDAITTDGVMAAAYLRIGETVRQMYGFAPCPAVPLTSDPWRHETQLGEAFARFIQHCPYFTDSWGTDRENPVVDFSWPPVGSFVTIPQDANPRTLSVRAFATDEGNSGLHLALYYVDGNLFDFDRFDVLDGDHTGATYTLPWWDSLAGRRVFDATLTDMNGNVGVGDATLIGMELNEDLRGRIANNTLWVRRPASEDDRPRDASSPRGTFNNPHATVAEAVAASISLGSPRAVIVGRGVHPMTASVEVPGGTALIGEETGACVLDGEGRDIILLHQKGDTGNFTDITISNLVFRNARAGIVQVRGVASWNNLIANNVFQDLTGMALSLNDVGGTHRILQNTVIHCGEGIVLDGFYPFNDSDFLRVQNNVVAGCTGRGISLTNANTLYERGRSGYNVAFGNETDFTGDGDRASGLEYVSSRLEGEFSRHPFFAIAANGNVSPVPGTMSPLLKAGDVRTHDADGQRRAIGAILAPEATLQNVGDANGDGIVTPQDAENAFLCFLLGDCVLAGWPGAADIGPGFGDGVVTPSDAAGIFEMYLGLR